MSEPEVFQALASKSRLNILKLLYKKPLSIDEIATATGLQPVTIRHHLQALEEADFIESYEERQGTVGRPKVFYRIAKETHHVVFPKRHYMMLSDALVTMMRSLLGTDRTKSILRKVGTEMGEGAMKKLELDHGVKEWSVKSFKDHFINKYLIEAGAEPEIMEETDTKIVYRLHNCLFFELAVKMPEIMCDVLHESFHDGVANVMGKQAAMSRGSCMGKGDPYCEHVFEWKE